MPNFQDLIDVIAEVFEITGFTAIITVELWKKSGGKRL